LADRVVAAAVTGVERIAAEEAELKAAEQLLQAEGGVPAAAAEGAVEIGGLSSDVSATLVAETESTSELAPEDSEAASESGDAVDEASTVDDDVDGSQVAGADAGTADEAGAAVEAGAAEEAGGAEKETPEESVRQESGSD
jgi:hypothetical protein